MLHVDHMLWDPFWDAATMQRQQITHHQLLHICTLADFVASGRVTVTFQTSITCQQHVSHVTAPSIPAINYT
jgi:hypothetical protein